MILLVKTKDNNTHSIEVSEYVIEAGILIFKSNGILSAMFPISEIISVVVELENK
jgi:hypothetical protein